MVDVRQGQCYVIRVQQQHKTSHMLGSTKIVAGKEFTKLVDLLRKYVTPTIQTDYRQLLVNAVDRELTRM